MNIPFTANKDSFTFHIRLTKKCNASCSYCSSFENKHSNLMSLEDLKKSLNFIKKLIIDKKMGGNKEHITVQYVGGEVLIVPEDYLKTFVETVKTEISPLFKSFSHGVQSNLISSPVKTKVLFELFDGNLGTSFDHHTKQRTVKNSSSHYQKIFFQNYSHLKKNFGKSLPGILVIDEKMFPFVESELQLAHEKKYNITLRPVFQGGSTINSITTINLTNLYEQIFNDWFMKKDIIIEPFFSLLKKRLANKQKKIEQLHHISGCPFQHNCVTSSINLEPDGNLYVCLDMADSKHYPFGNAISEILNEEVFSLLSQRSEKLNQDCIKCDYFNECQGGCMNEAIEHTQDVFGKTQYCETWKKTFSQIDDKINELGFSIIEKWILRLESYR